MQRPDKDSAISTDAFFGNLTRIRNVILPTPVRSGLNTGRGLLGGFIVVHLVFLIFAASLSLRGEAFSDTFIYRDWAMAGFNDANLRGGPSPWVYPILALIPMSEVRRRHTPHAFGPPGAGKPRKPGMPPSYAD